MQKIRLFMATILLSITGFAVFGVRAIASPRTLTGPVPPQACSMASSGTNGSTGSSGTTSITGASIGYTGSSTIGTGTGTGSDNNPSSVKRSRRG